MTQILDLGDSAQWLSPDNVWPRWLNAAWLSDRGIVAICRLSTADDLTKLRSRIAGSKNLLAYPHYEFLYSKLSPQEQGNLQAVFLKCLGATQYLEILPGQDEPGTTDFNQLSNNTSVKVNLELSKPSLALVAPLPPSHSDIANYCAQILPSLAEHYEITLVIEDPESLEPSLGSRFTAISHCQMMRIGNSFDRIVYHFENSPLQYEYFSLLKAHPGFVVLHDIVLGDAVLGNFDELEYYELRQMIYTSNGWSALASCGGKPGTGITAYSACGSVLTDSYGALLVEQSGLDSLAHYFNAQFPGQVVPEFLDTQQPADNFTEKFTKAIEHAYTDSPKHSANQALHQTLAEKIGQLPASDIWACCEDFDDLLRCTGAMAPRLAGQQLLVDISAVVQHDLESGIQRVVRNILRELLRLEKTGQRVEAIYYDFESDCFRYARNFVADFLNIPQLDIYNDPVEVRRNDIYLGLDLYYIIAGREVSRRWFQYWRGRGAKIYHVIYDLLPVKLPDCFPTDQMPLYKGWLEAITQVSDGLVCISKAVSDEYADWYSAQGYSAQYRPKIGYFHLGAEMEAKSTSEAEVLLPQNINQPYLLMVGTIEPRKGHQQVIEAFEILWSQGIKLSLVVVGSMGWLEDKLATRINGLNSEAPNFHYMNFVSDSLLQTLYCGAASTIMASRGEGFGLPLIEAAFNGSALIARDLPVFREVCGDSAWYFSAEDAAGLAEQLKEWHGLYKSGSLPNSGRIQSLNWEQSAGQLLRCIHDQDWYLP